MGAPNFDREGWSRNSNAPLPQPPQAHTQTVSLLRSRYSDNALCTPQGTRRCGVTFSNIGQGRTGAGGARALSSAVLPTALAFATPNAPLLRQPDDLLHHTTFLLFTHTATHSDRAGSQSIRHHCWGQRPLTPGNAHRRRVAGVIATSGFRIANPTPFCTRCRMSLPMRAWRGPCAASQAMNRRLWQ